MSKDDVIEMEGKVVDALPNAVFLVELANRGGIERIVSFIIVGLLLLFVGWFAPVPPKEKV